MIMEKLFSRETKIVFLDWGVFMHRAIFGWENNKTISPTYTCLSMLIANLKRVGVHPDDIIIVAVDSPKGSWRRDVDSQYKANRKAAREKHEDIDWQLMFNKFDNLLENLKVSTPFHIIRIDKLEADDIIAYGVKYYKDKECVVISTDSDFEQLAAYKNVKL